MSLAIYASPYNNSDDVNVETTNKKQMKQNKKHNKTQKIIRPTDDTNSTSKMMQMMQRLHSSGEEDDSSDLSDFIPPPKPMSAGSERMVQRSLENETQNVGVIEDTTMNVSDNDVVVDSQRNAEPIYSRQYTTPLTSGMPQDIPNVSSFGMLNPSTTSPSDPNNGDLMSRVNYMIGLMEDLKDQKTDNVMEEVILYSFLGVFMIFIVDSFARVGKYVR